MVRASVMMSAKRSTPFAIFIAKRAKRIHEAGGLTTCFHLKLPIYIKQFLKKLRVSLSTVLRRSVNLVYYQFEK